MYRKFILTSFLLFTFIAIVYPAKKENTKLFDYCYALEKILTRNTFKTKRNLSGQLNTISKDVAKFSTSKSRGALVSNMIDRYKISKNSFLINFLPNQLYCLGGYWIETLKPGTFESIIYDKSKKTINEFKDLKDQVDVLIDDINSEYKIIKKELKLIFK